VAGHETKIALARADRASRSSCASPSSFVEPFRQLPSCACPVPGSSPTARRHSIRAKRDWSWG